MKTFLQEVVDTLQQQESAISDLILILPSIRAGLFIKELIKSAYVDQTLFAPKIISIEEFITELSELQSIDNTTALFEFYNTYLNTHTDQEKEEFESFTPWAQTLIYDFNEVDRYLLDPKDFFNYLSNIKDIDHWYLQPEKTPLVKRYISFWQNLENYYTTFVNQLVGAKKGYQGLQYRIAASKIDVYTQKANKKHVFIGFNALNEAEQQIIQHLLNAGKAQVFWDIDKRFYEDRSHGASLFIRQYVERWSYFKKHQIDWIHTNFSSPKQLTVVGTPKQIGQAKYVGELLSKLPKEKLNRTAIVLGDESLLLPILNAIPEDIKDINITMGLPLREIPLAIFFEALLQIQIQSSNRGFYYKPLLDLLQNQTVFWLLGTTTYLLAEKITQENLVYPTLQQLLGHVPKAQIAVFKLLFDPMKSVEKAIARFQELLQLLKDHLENQNSTLELEYCYRFYVIFNKLHQLQQQYNYVKTLSGLQKLYHELLGTETLDFRGEPFRGLQLMGMLESRCLDFETVIITGVNEGILPAGKSTNSFIPFDLKRSYELPTYKEKDAIYTYHFYRLLQRADRAYMLYNTESGGQNAGEKSRFLLQLEIENEPTHQLENYVVGAEVPSITAVPLRIAKNAAVIKKLEALAAYGFSPSALTGYIRNPIDFYHRYVLGIQEQDHVEETIATNTLGTVVHNVLENLYKPFVGKTVTTHDVKRMLLEIDAQVRQEFKSVYTKMNITEGKNLVIFEVAKRYVFNLLKSEQRLLASGAELEIVAIECNLQAELQIAELDFPVFIKGKVDRVDKLNGQLRIIDYKTGNVTKSALEISDWEVLTEDYKYSKAFQVLTYAYLHLHNQPMETTIEGGIISFKNLKEGFLKFGTKIAGSRTKEHFINQRVLEKYFDELKRLILEICNPNIYFEEKEV